MIGKSRFSHAGAHARNDAGIYNGPADRKNLRSTNQEFLTVIRSMTAFGSAKAETEHGTLTLEIRSVNSRFLDLNFRLPDELRMLETTLREHISKAIT